VGPNLADLQQGVGAGQFQSSVRINVGPNPCEYPVTSHVVVFQSSVRINVGPNALIAACDLFLSLVSILRED